MRHFGNVFQFGFASLLVLCSNAFAESSCAIQINQIGPVEVKTGEPGSYVLRIENKAGCPDQKLRITTRLPDYGRFRRAYPTPVSVEEQEFPKGPKVTWREIVLGSGKVTLVEVGVILGAPAYQTVSMKTCAKVIDFWDPEFCQRFPIRIVR